jgi:hypothetical protein
MKSQSSSWDMDTYLCTKKQTKRQEYREKKMVVRRVRNDCLFGKRNSIPPPSKFELQVHAAPDSRCLVFVLEGKQSMRKTGEQGLKL